MTRRRLLRTPPRLILGRPRSSLERSIRLRHAPGVKGALGNGEGRRHRGWCAARPATRAEGPCGVGPTAPNRQVTFSLALPVLAAWVAVPAKWAEIVCVPVDDGV